VIVPLGWASSVTEVRISLSRTVLLPTRGVILCSGAETVRK